MGTYDKDSGLSKEAGIFFYLGLLMRVIIYRYGRRYGLRPCCRSLHRAASAAASDASFYRIGVATGDSDEVLV